MVAGLALTGIGIVGTVTGAAPLVIGAIGLKTALGSYGAYNAARGGGEYIGNKQVGNAEDKTTIGEELGVQEKQTTTRRWSKRAGAAMAAIVGTIGVFKLADALTNRPPAPPTDHRYGSINNGRCV